MSYDSKSNRFIQNSIRKIDLKMIPRIDLTPNLTLITFGYKLNLPSPIKIHILINKNLGHEPPTHPGHQCKFIKPIPILLLNIISTNGISIWMRKNLYFLIL